MASMATTEYKDGFHYWLESNVNTKGQFPKNKTSNFTTPLNAEQLLDGEWEVCCKEVFVPNYHFNVFKPMNHFIFADANMADDDVYQSALLRVRQAEERDKAILRNRHKGNDDVDGVKRKSEGPHEGEPSPKAASMEAQPLTDLFPEMGGNIVNVFDDEALQRRHEDAPDAAPEGFDEVDDDGEGEKKKSDKELAKESPLGRFLMGGVGKSFQEIQREARRRARRAKNKKGDKQSTAKDEIKSVQFHFSIPAGKYTADTFCRTYNMTLDKVTKHIYRDRHTGIRNILKYNHQSKRISVRLTSGQKALFLSARLRKLMGFEMKIGENNVEAATLHSQYAEDVPGSQDQFLPNPAYFNRYSQTMHMYADIVRTSGVGSTSTSLLRLINIDAAESVETIHREFINPQFVPVCLNRFRTITIELRDDMGEEFAFERGDVKATLYFRQLPPYMG